MIRVLVVDDHPAVRTGLVALLRLEPGLVPVATAETGAEALEHARTRHPDVALIDYHLPDIDGLALCGRIRALDQPPKVVIYSAFADDRLALPAALLGAHAVVCKSSSSDDLFEVIRAAATDDNGLAPSPELLGAAQDAVALEDLPILGMLADRTPVEEIADVLGITRAEIDGRIEGIVASLKLGIDRRLPRPEPARRG